MIVSFDLDDTLFVSESKFKTEPQLKFPWNHIYRERLRLGTVALMKYIRQKNIQLWIYTTSYRSERYIRGLFRHYGIRLDQISHCIHKYIAKVFLVIAVAADFLVVFLLLFDGF